MIKAPFQPQYGATVAAVTAAAAVNVNVSAAVKNLLIVNAATGIVFIRVKPSGVAADASVTDMPLLPNQSRVISKDGGHDQGSSLGQTVVSVFSPGGALGTVWVCPGEGYGGL
ncbi:MAG: hypothetical protein ING77_11620 [Rhodocyclaceae bacterium]|jgi:hypothetical protein|nr:hypothetical protein [Rhodocyclaceae bacterium]